MVSKEISDSYQSKKYYEKSKKEIECSICKSLGMFHSEGDLYRRMIFSYFSRIWIYSGGHVG